MNKYNKINDEYICTTRQTRLSSRIIAICIFDKSINTFASEEKKISHFFLENASKLTYEFCMKFL